MKRFFFSVIALATVAFGCTKSGLLESPSTYETPIAFEPYAGRAPVTKATIEDSETIKSGFRVIGFKEGTDGAIINAQLTDPFLHKLVKYDNTQSKWTYSGAMYWPETEALTFVAYGLNVNGTPEEATDSENNNAYIAGDAKPGTKFVQGDDYVSYTYNVGATAAEHKDLVISPAMRNCTSADASGTADGDTKANTVNVKLYHVLSRIGFKLAIENSYTVDGGQSQPSTQPVTINSIRLIGSFINVGSFNLTSAVSVSGETVEYAAVGGDRTANTSYSLFSDGQSFTYTPTGAETSVHPIYDTTDDAATNASDDRYMMIIPGDANPTGGNVKVEVKYTIGAGDETIATLPIKQPNGAALVFEAGKAYEFILTVSNVAVGFNVEVSEWIPADDTENDLN